MEEVVATVVVPTYKERPNLRPLITRVFAALSRFPALHNKVELIVVDDNSCDGSAEEVASLSREGLPCRVIVRTRERGLSSAVIRGFEEGRGKVLLCMDADLQHPPEKVPELLAALLDTGKEFAIGTRYAGAVLSVDEGWPLYRRVISWGARVLARPLR